MSPTLSRVAGSEIRLPWRMLAGVLLLNVSLCAWLAWRSPLASHLNATLVFESPAASITISVLGTLAGLGLALWIWTLAVRHLRLWRRTLNQAMEARARAEEALRHSQEQLEVRVRQRTAALSAEMLDRQPTAETRPETGEESQAISATAHEAMIPRHGILDISTKIEAGKPVLETLDFDLQEVLDTTLVLVAERAHSKNIELTSSVPSEVPTRLRGDPIRLRQILMNLLSNALKFTEQGQVIVRLAKQSETPTRVTLCFAVEDTGMGISPAGQSRLFQAISPMDESIQRQSGGAGLGLAISKQLVELMGGQIGVESEPGKGSTFWFTTAWEKQPAEMAPVKPDEPAVAAPSAAASASIPPLRILLAQDNLINQQVALGQLCRFGLTANVATDGLAVLAALEQSPYDVILMDCQMPEMDGFQTTREIRQRERRQGPRRIHIIAMTARAMQGDQKACLAAGMNDYISMPVSQVDLQKALERCHRNQGDNGLDAVVLTALSRTEPVDADNLNAALAYD